MPRRSNAHLARAPVARQLLCATVVLACASCRRTEPSSSDAAPSASTPAPSAAPSAPPPPASSSAPAPRAPLQLLRFRFTTGVHGKEPVDELLATAPGERVYAHLAIRNRSGEARKIHMVFRVAGSDRTSLDLEVQPSWSYRTWGFNTLRAGDDRGDVQVVVTDDGGAVLVDEKVPIAKKTRTK